MEFDTIAREWRLKWSPDNDKKSLASAQQSKYIPLCCCFSISISIRLRCLIITFITVVALSLFKSALEKIDGVKSVQRVVCGGCLDFKVVVALPTEKFQAWVSYFKQCLFILYHHVLYYVMSTNTCMPIISIKLR